MAILVQGKLPQAEELHRRALKIRQYTLGEDHPSTVASLCHLAVSLREQGKTHAGDLLLRRAGEIRATSRGKGRMTTLARERQEHKDDAAWAVADRGQAGEEEEERQQQALREQKRREQKRREQEELQQQRLMARHQQYYARMSEDGKAGSGGSGDGPGRGLAGGRRRKEHSRRVSRLAAE